MSLTLPRTSPSRWKAIQLYKERLRPLLEPVHNGKYVAVDPITSAYRVAATKAEACRTLSQQLPESQPFVFSVGEPVSDWYSAWNEWSKSPEGTAELEETMGEVLSFYERELKPRYEPLRTGEFAAVDPNTWDYEIDADSLVAHDRLRERHPEGEFFTLEIGQPVVPCFSL